MGITDRKVTVRMPFGTNLSDLTASFTTNATRVLVNSTEQVSGVTRNDFRTPVIYRLETANGYNEWTVNVTNSGELQPDSSIRFGKFELDGGKVLGIIDNTIYIALKDGSDITHQIAAFTTDAEKVWIGGTEQISGATANDFSSKVTYRLTTASGYNDWAVVTFNYDLPTLFVATPGKASIQSKTNWMGGVTVTVFDNKSGKLDTLGRDDEKAPGKADINEIKGRGNSTWGYVKKPYTIKLKKKSKALGMPSDKRWNLLANWMDRTDLRNDIALELGRRSPGLSWNPKGRFVELVLNGQYNGNYYLCEHIKIAKDRVNITGYDEDVPSVKGADVGYLLEFDTYYDESNKFKSSLNLPVNLKDPDCSGYDISYIRNWINALESKLIAADITETDYRDYLDMDSFIDWWFVYEMVGNAEPNHPKSSYMYKDRDTDPGVDSKIHAGPCWDFDWKTFTVADMDRAHSFIIKNAIWYSYLFKDSAFVARAKEKWAAQKSLYEDVANVYIDQVSSQIRNSVERDKQKWPCTSSINQDNTLSFDEAVARIKSVLQEKISWMDSQISSW